MKQPKPLWNSSETHSVDQQQTIHIQSEGRIVGGWHCGGFAGVSSAAVAAPLVVPSFIQSFISSNRERATHAIGPAAFDHGHPSPAAFPGQF